MRKPLTLQLEALRLEIRAQGRRRIEDTGDANYYEARADTLAGQADKLESPPSLPRRRSD